MASGIWRNASGTITAGGTAQTALTENTGRQYVLIHNPISESESLLFDFGATAAAGSAIELAPGGTATFEDAFTPGALLSVLAATTGHKFVIKWA